MSRKYAAAIFQPTVRPSWVGILSYISQQEQADILEAILKYPNKTDINSRFWDETIEPDLKAQYEAFKRTNEDKGRASRDYWNSKRTPGKDMITNTLPKGEDMVTNTILEKEDMVTSLKDKDKDKDKNKDKDKDKNNIRDLEKIQSKPLGKPFIRWLDYRKQLKKPYRSQMSVDECYNKLERLSGGNVAMAEKIVNQSIAQGWQGLFELKEVADVGKDYNRNAEPGKYAGFGRKFES